MRLNGKTAIVTGGGSGFGAAMVELFAAEGARLVVADIDAAAAERVAAGVPGAVAVQADVTRDDDTGRMVAAATGAISSPWNDSSFPTSAIASTAFTPGAFSAEARSMETMRARGCGDRRKCHPLLDVLHHVPLRPDR